MAVPTILEDDEMNFLPVAAALVTMVWNPLSGTSTQALPGFLTEAKATAPKSVKKGKEFTVPVTFTVKPGYHVYAPKPGDENAIPTTIELEDGSAYKIASIKWPDAHKDPMGVFIMSGKVDVTVQLVAPAAKASKSVLKLKLRSQGCDDSSCLPPATVSLLSVIEVK
jgi:DsbC/DsbD-like thiol-disulfide interchange protein